MKYFIARIQYTEPVPGKDTVRKVNKNVLVRADSVTEVEVRVTTWFYDNWQDPFVKAVTGTTIQELLEAGESETWWQIRVMFEDTDTAKWTPYVLAVNGGSIETVVAKVRKTHSMGEIEEIKKLKVEIDDTLLN